LQHRWKPRPNRVADSLVDPAPRPGAVSPVHFGELDRIPTVRLDPLPWLVRDAVRPTSKGLHTVAGSLRRANIWPRVTFHDVIATGMQGELTGDDHRKRRAEGSNDIHLR